MPARPDKPRSRTRRWVTRLAVALLVLIVLLIVVAQIVLWTNLPRDIALNAVQKTLGLRVTAARLSTGFFGRTTLRDVSLALPLADESFLYVPTMRVSHTSALGLIFKRAVAVEAIEIDGPSVVVRQDATGRWNLQEVADLLTRAGGGGASHAPTGSRPATVALPRVRLSNGRIHVIANTGAQADLSPVTLIGEPEGPLTWKFDAAVGERLKAVGRVAPGGEFAHEVNLVLRDAGPWVALVAPGFDHDVALSAEWRGALRSGAVAGRLDVREARFDDLTAHGPIAVVTSDAETGSLVAIDARGLVVRTGRPVLPEVAVVGGAARVAATGGTVTVDRLRLALAGGNASISARYQPAAGALTAGAVWQDLLVAGANIRSGSFDVTITQPLPDRPRVAASLATTGDAGAGRNTWDVALELTGDGRGRRPDGTGGGLADVDWTTVAKRLALSTGARNADLAGTTARLSTTGSIVMLTSLSRPDLGPTAVAGGGQFDAASGDWYAHVDAGGPVSPLAFSASAWQRGDTISLDHGYVRAPGMEITARGFYLTREPEPVFLNVSLTQRHDDPDIKLAALASPPLIGGRVLGDFYVHGKVHPLDFYAEGWLTGQQVVLAGRDLGNLKVTADAKVGPGMKWQAQTHELSLFDGRWSVEAGAPTPWDATRIKLRVTDLPLASVAAALDRHQAPPTILPTTALSATTFAVATSTATTQATQPAPLLAGTFNGQWTFDVTDFNPAGITSVGVFDVAGLRAGPVAAQSLNGRTRLDNGRLRNDVILKQDDGVATFAVESAMATPRLLDVTADVRQWPLAPTPGTQTITALGGTFQINLADVSATGSAKIESAVTRDGQPFGGARATLAAGGRIVRLDNLDATLAGGTATGSAVVDLDDLKTATATVTVNDVAGPDLARIFPAAHGLTGTYDAALALGPDTGPRPLAPLAATLTITPSSSAGFAAMDLGRLDARAAIEPDQSWRVVLDRFDLNVAGGLVSLWARVIHHTTDDPILVAAGRAHSTVTQASLRWRGVELNQLVQSAKPGEKALYAKLNGRANVLTSTLTDNIVADGYVGIHEGKLVNFEPIRRLFQQLGVAPRGMDEPGVGEGRMRVLYEGGLLRVSGVEYFENGIDMRAFATVSNLAAGKSAPVNGQIVGSLRPFKELKIPFMATADEILNLIQSSVTPIRIFGTVGDIKAEPGFVGDAKGALRELFTGQSGGTGQE
jgi:hypothetical protein